MAFQIKFVGKIPEGTINEYMALAGDMASSKDGIIVVGYDINPSHTFGLMQVINAAAALGRSGCQRVGFIWALPF